MYRRRISVKKEKLGKGEKQAKGGEGKGEEHGRYRGKEEKEST